MRLPLLALALLAACADPPAAPTPPASVEGRVPVPADSGAMAPRLVTGADGATVLSWVEPTATGHALRTARWTGDSWADAQTAATGDDWFVNWADTPGVLPLDGTLLAHTLPRHPSGDSPYAYDVALRLGHGPARLLHDDGTAAEHGFVTAVPLPDGRAGMVWLDGRNQAGSHSHGGGAMSLRFAALGPDGAKSGETVLDARTCDCCPTAAVATRDGVLVAYRDRSEDEIRDIAVVRLVDGEWTEPVIPHPDRWPIVGCPVNGPALAAQGDRVVMAWYTEGDGARVRAARSDDGGATWADPVEIDGTAPIGRVGVAMLDNGTAVVSWLDADGDTARLGLRTVGPDGALGEVQTVATVDAGRASGIPHVAGLGDRVLMAWTDAEAGTVRSAVVVP